MIIVWIFGFDTFSRVGMGPRKNPEGVSVLCFNFFDNVVTNFELHLKSIGLNK